MDKFIEKVIDWTDCSEEDITEVYCDEVSKMFAVAYTDDDGFCHSYLVRCLELQQGNIEVSVDFENCTRMEDAHDNVGLICKKLAKIISNI